MFSTSAARTLLTYKESCQCALFLWFGHFLGQTKFKLPVSLLKGWKHGVPLSFQLSMFCSSFSRLVTSCENGDIWTSWRFRKSNYTKPFISIPTPPKKVILERLLSLSMSTESIGAKIAFVRRVSDPEKCRRDHLSPDPWRKQIWKAIQCIFENPPIGFAKLFSSPPKRKRMGAELICNIVSVGFSIFFFVTWVQIKSSPLPPFWLVGRTVTKVANLIKGSRPLSKLHLTRRKPGGWSRTEWLNGRGKFSGQPTPSFLVRVNLI